MTKEMMLREMLADVKWTDKHKESFIRDCKATKKRIKFVYDFWVENQDKSYFCIGLL